jgi:glycosyltransferase involved in cell wall biosynthesis
MSVVVPVHNTDIELIERALNSALTQEIDEGTIELVIVDDASTDKRVRNYLEQLRNIKYSRNLRQLGVGRSREKGAHLSQGRF